jgi:DNA adenine methylase
VAPPHSPLRYPGGKQILAGVLAHLIRTNDREGGIYAEPYAGGAGAALTLLFSEHVQSLMLNDADSNIYAFWHSVLNRTDEFLKLLRDASLTTKEWHRQREIYIRPTEHSSLDLGFSTFYLNRCNRSGIIVNGGMIGGQNQAGKWKLDARFNKDELARRVQRIALYRKRISLFNLDAVDFLLKHIDRPDIASKVFVYLDPPYYNKGSQLYLNYYAPADHGELATYIAGQGSFLWVMSYDDVRDIRRLYSGLRQVHFALGYSARTRRIGKEVLVLSDKLKFPERWKSRLPGKYLTAADGISIPLAG